MDSEFIAFITKKIGISFVVTIFSYLFIPVCIVLLEKKYEIKKLKKINTLNCILVWSIFRIIEIASGNTPSSGTAVFLWGAVSYWILKKNCLKESPKPAVPIEDKPQVKTQPTQVSTPAVNKSIKYCSHCGNPIDPATKQCLGCGKQYFKGVSWKQLLGVFFILSLMLNIHFCFNTMALEDLNSMLEETNASLKTEISNKESTIKNLNSNISELRLNNNELQRKIKTYSEEIDFYDRHIVFVADDGSRLYHNYSCFYFQNCTSFWVYGFEEADQRGYKPCSLCLD